MTVSMMRNRALGDLLAGGRPMVGERADGDHGRTAGPRDHQHRSRHRTSGPSSRAGRGVSAAHGTAHAVRRRARGQLRSWTHMPPLSSSVHIGHSVSISSVVPGRRQAEHLLPHGARTCRSSGEDPAVCLLTVAIIVPEGDIPADSESTNPRSARRTVWKSPSPGTSAAPAATAPLAWSTAVNGWRVRCAERQKRSVRRRHA